MRFLRVALVVTLVIISVMAAGYSLVYLLNQWQYHHWKKYVTGPFHGTPYTGDIVGQALSRLEVSSHSTLEVHKTELGNDPMLLLRSPSNTITWAYSLRPAIVSSDGTTNQAKIFSLRLMKIKHASDGYEVLFNCYWDHGGNENGVARLTQDLEFRD